MEGSSSETGLMASAESMLCVSPISQMMMTSGYGENKYFHQENTVSSWQIWRPFSCASSGTRILGRTPACCLCSTLLSQSKQTNAVVTSAEFAHGVAVESSCCNPRFRAAQFRTLRTEVVIIPNFSAVCHLLVSACLSSLCNV